MGGLHEVLQGGEAEFGEHLLLGGDAGTDMAGEEGEIPVRVSVGRGWSRPFFGKS